MGISIMMRPGTLLRSKGDPEVITPAFQSLAAILLRGLGRSNPMELNRDHVPRLELMAHGASVYVYDDDNIWLKIIAAINEHDCVVISLEG